MNIISIILLFVCITSSRLTNLQDTFIRVGCSTEGLLYPSQFNQHAWKRLKNVHDFMNFLHESSHPLARSSCQGTQSPSEGNSELTLHASWECYDESNSCALPTANLKTLNTVVYHHPGARVVIWSNSLPSQLPTMPDVEIRRYDNILFDDLPSNAQIASKTIPNFFENNPNSHSHFSDLLRISILYKFGGIWFDLDSLFLKDIRSLSEKEWVPKTFHDGVDFAIADNSGKKFIIEGGMMKFEKGSPFLHSVLERFPVYDSEIADCWACVGPKLLTETYLNSKTRPPLLPSTRLFGNQKYRENLSRVFLANSLDLQLLHDHIVNDAIAVHLFTSTGEREVQFGSLIDLMLQSAEVGASPTTELYVPLGPLSRRRRRLEGSSTYGGDFHFLFFQLQISSPSYSQLPSNANTKIKAAISEETTIPIADIVIRVFEQEDVVLVDVQAQWDDDYGVVVSIINRENFASILNRNSYLSEITISASTQAVEADLDLEDISEFEGRPQIANANTSTSEDDGDDWDFYLLIAATVLAVILCGLCCFVYFWCFMDRKRVISSQSNFEMAYWDDSNNVGGGSFGNWDGGSSYQKRQPEGHVQYVWT